MVDRKNFNVTAKLNLHNSSLKASSLLLHNNKQLLDEVFVISRIIKVEVVVISRICFIVH